MCLIQIELIGTIIERQYNIYISDGDLSGSGLGAYILYLAVAKKLEKIAENCESTYLEYCCRRGRLGFSSHQALLSVFCVYVILPSLVG